MRARLNPGKKNHDPRRRADDSPLRSIQPSRNRQHRRRCCVVIWGVIIRCSEKQRSGRPVHRRPKKGKRQMAEICWPSRLGNRRTRLKHLSQKLAFRHRVGLAVWTGRAQDCEKGMETGQTSASTHRPSQNRRRKHHLAGGKIKPLKTEKADRFTSHIRQAWQAAVSASLR